MSLVMDREDLHGLIVGETLEIGLQLGGFLPYVIKYYGTNTDLGDVLKEASDHSRGQYLLFSLTWFFLTFAVYLFALLSKVSMHCT